MPYDLIMTDQTVTRTTLQEMDLHESKTVSISHRSLVHR